MQPRAFHLGDILSISTGYLVSPRHIEGVYDILNFMTQDDLYTHQLPRAAEACKPFLLRQMPWLAEIDASMVTGENWETWLAAQVATHGEFHDVLPMHSEDHAVRDPIEELSQMAPQATIVVVSLGDTADF